MQLRLLPLSLSLVSLVAAQQAPTVDEIDALVRQAGQEALVPSLTRVLFDAPGDGHIYARGRTWKGEFGPDGSTYIPYLGADAPQNYPLTFRLQAASVGGVELNLDAKPQVSRSANRVVIDHGTLLEVYDLDVDSIEQSFILPSRQRRGEIRVRMAVDSTLQGEPQGRGLRFLGPDGGAAYGEAFAFDDAGRRTDVSSTLEGNQLELVVPDAFPIEGDGRVVIDPVLTTVLTSGSGFQVSIHPDVAFEKDVDGGVYLLVYEVRNSTIDSDVYSAEIVKATGQVRNVVAVDISSDDWSHPRVANNDGGNSFLIVAEARPSGSSLSDIMSRLRVAGGTGISLPNPLNSQPGAQRATTPDVGGQSLAFPGLWCIVYSETLSETSRIRAQGVTSTGSKVGPALLLSAGLIEDSQPRISESAGEANVGDQLFNVVWSRRNSPTDRDVYAAQLEPSFTGVSVFTQGFHLGQLGDAHSPSVSSLASDPLPATGNRPWVVASIYDGNQSSDVIVQVLSGTQVHAFHNVTQMEDNAFASQFTRPSVGCTGSSFALTYASLDDITGRTRVYMNTMYLADNSTGASLALAERRQEIIHNNLLGAETPSLVTEWESGDLDSDEGLIGWTGEGGLGSHFVYATQFEAYNTTAIGTQFCAANDNSTQENGWLAMYGGQDAGGSNVALAYDLPPGESAYLICSQTSGSVFNPGGSAGRLCLGGAIGRMIPTLTTVLPSGIGLFVLNSSSLATPTGTVAAQPGETWYFQCWHRDNVSGSPTSNFTNGVRVQYQ